MSEPEPEPDTLADKWHAGAQVREAASVCKLSYHDRSKKYETEKEDETSKATNHTHVPKD